MVWGALVGSSQQVPSNPSTLYDDLVAYWKLGEASGTRADSVGNNDLTDNNTVAQAAGKIGNAADFEFDNSEYLSILDNTDLRMGDIDFTIACWVKIESKGTIENRGIIGKWTVGGNQREYLLYHDYSANRFSFIASSDGTTGVGSFASVTADNLGVPALDTWYYIVAWHDATANKIYIRVNNGTADEAAWSGGVYDGTSAFRIGAMDSGAPATWWDGLVDEAAIWKRVLTTAEQTELYNSGNGLGLY